MVLNRQALKLKAKARIKNSEPKVINVGLVYVLLGSLVSVLSARVMGANITESDMAQIYEHLAMGNADFAVEYLRQFMPPVSSYFVDLALDVVMMIVSAGFIIFLLNSIRAAAPCTGNLLDGFGVAGRLILLSILESVFIFLWSLLLVVPGIIAFYRYRQAIYLVLDHPEMSVTDCIRESKRMMNGKKGELFMLDMSFIGWHLLSAFTVIGWAVQIWSVPYTGMCYAMYYELLCGKLDGEGLYIGSFNTFNPDI